MRIFKNMHGNIPGENFLDGSFPGGGGGRGGGANSLGGSFNWLEFSGLKFSWYHFFSRNYSSGISVVSLLKSNLLGFCWSGINCYFIFSRIKAYDQKVSLSHALKGTKETKTLKDFQRLNPNLLRWQPM